MLGLANVSIDKHPLGPFPPIRVTVRRHPGIGTGGDHANVILVRVSGVGLGDLVDRVDMGDLLSDMEFAASACAHGGQGQGSQI